MVQWLGFLTFIKKAWVQFPVKEYGYLRQMTNVKITAEIFVVQIISANRTILFSLSDSYLFVIDIMTGHNPRVGFTAVTTFKGRGGEGRRGRGGHDMSQ